MLNKLLIWLGIAAILVVIALNILQRGIVTAPKVATGYALCLAGY